MQRLKSASAAKSLRDQDSWKYGEQDFNPEAILQVKAQEFKRLGFASSEGQEFDTSVEDPKLDDWGAGAEVGIGMLRLGGVEI